MVGHPGVGEAVALHRPEHLADQPLHLGEARAECRQILFDQRGEDDHQDQVRDASDELGGWRRRSRKASSSAAPLNPGGASGIARTQRQSAGMARRSRSGAGPAPWTRRPPSRRKPPCSNAQVPMPERWVRPVASARPGASKGRSKSAASARAVARAS